MTYKEYTTAGGSVPPVFSIITFGTGDGSADKHNKLSDFFADRFNNRECFTEIIADFQTALAVAAARYVAAVGAADAIKDGAGTNTEAVNVYAAPDGVLDLDVDAEQPANATGGTKRRTRTTAATSADEQAKYTVYPLDVVGSHLAMFERLFLGVFPL